MQAFGAADNFADNSDASSGTNVYVCNLPLTVTLKRFRAYFGTFGTIIGARLVPRRKGHSPVGFVQYTTHAMACAAIAALDGREMDGFVLAVTMARRDKDKGIHNKPSPNLYVANLPQKLGEPEIHLLFSRFGLVHSVRLLRYPDTGASKGTALIRFGRLEHAMAAKEALHCCPMQRHGLPLEVKFAESRDERLSRRDELLKQQQPKKTKPATSPTTTGLPPPSIAVTAPVPRPTPGQLFPGTEMPAGQLQINAGDWITKWMVADSVVASDAWSWMDEPELYPEFSAAVVNPDFNALGAAVGRLVEGKGAPERELDSALSTASFGSSHGYSSCGSAFDAGDAEWPRPTAPADPIDQVPPYWLPVSEPNPMSPRGDDDLEAHLSKLEEFSSLLALNWP